MNKKIKVVLGILIIIVIMWVIIFIVDYNRCSNLEMPIFVIKSKINDSVPTKECYYGLGYKVNVEKNSSNKDDILKIEMYMASKFITGAIADTKNINNVSNDNEETNTFRAIVITSNINYIEVTPILDKDKKILSDKVSLGLDKNNDDLYSEGQELFITYKGPIMESYPTQINAIKIETETEHRTKIEDLPKDYTLIEAVRDNSVINVHNRKLYNKDELDRFIDNVNNNIPDFIRCIIFTIEGDMLIEDVNFEGSGSFRVTEDFTRDEYAGIDDRIYRYSRFKKMTLKKEDDATSIILEEPIEGNLEKVYVIGYNNETEFINNYEFKYLLDIKTSNKKGKTKITQDILKEKYNYDIYYYGIESCNIEIDGKKIDLIEALKTDKVTMEDIINQAEKDSKSGIIGNDVYKDGGSKIYFYNKYTIIKCNSIRNGGTNKDVYIGIKDMRLNDVI